MNTKQILIGVVVVGAAFWLYNRNKQVVEKPVTDTTKSNTDSGKVDSSKPALDLNTTRGIAKPKRRPKPNERSRGNVISTSAAQASTKSQAAAQNQIGVENAEFAFNGHTF